LDLRLAYPRPRPRLSSFKTKTKTKTLTSKTKTETQDLQETKTKTRLRGSRPRPRPRLVKTGFETSRDQDSSLENSKSVKMQKCSHSLVTVNKFIAGCGIELSARATGQHKVVQHRRWNGAVRQPCLFQHQLAEHRSLHPAVWNTQRIHRRTFVLVVSICVLEADPARISERNLTVCRSLWQTSNPRARLYNFLPQLYHFF